MIYENSLISSLSKNHIDKATIKLILADLKDEIEWDSDLIEIFAENGILDIAFELLDKNTIIDLLSSGEVDIKKYRELGWIPTNMSFPKGIFEKINNGRTIYNILTNLFDMNLDGNDFSPGGFYDNLCIEFYNDGSNFECIGGRDVLISMLETYGHLNGWYRCSLDSENYGTYARFYRDESEVAGNFICDGTETINNISNYYSLNPNEIQKYLQNEFNEIYSLDERLGTNELVSLALEFKLFYKL